MSSPLERSVEFQVGEVGIAMSFAHGPLSASISVPPGYPDRYRKVFAHFNKDFEHQGAGFHIITTPDLTEDEVMVQAQQFFALALELWKVQIDEARR